jgi:predicted nucleic acid-binding Zn ribbon protein
VVSSGRKRNARPLRKSKPIETEKRSISVTETPTAPKRSAKRYTAGRPRGQGERLAPWFSIANGTVKPTPGQPIRFVDGGVIVPSRAVGQKLHAWEHAAVGFGKVGASVDQDLLELSASVFEPLQRNVQASLERLVIRANLLERDKSQMRKRFPGARVEHTGTVNLVWEGMGDETWWGDFAFDTEGRLAENPLNPRAWFIAALRGAELMRFKRCPVCDQFFYAIRTDQKACSRVCNGNLRVRRWRSNQVEYERRRNFGVPGKRALLAHAKRNRGGNDDLP